tara:strand:+ start:239 stop:697 length:459 start_codon:yes stop_codon:yes gene_type:complete
MDTLQNNFINPVFGPIANLLKPIIVVDPMTAFYIVIILIVGVCIFLYYDTLMNMINNNKNLVGGSKGVTFTLYYVEWCPHCKVVKPEWKKLENDPDLEHITIVKINCEENESVVQEKNIEGFPTILLNNNGKEEAYNGNREYADFKNYLLNV